MSNNSLALTMDEDEARQQHIQHVLDEEMTPLECEQLAAGAGWRPFQAPDEHRVDRRDSDWPLAFAILWVSWRDFEKTAEQWVRLQVWGRWIWRDQRQDGQRLALEEAETQVWRALQSGSVASIGRRYQERVGGAATANNYYEDLGRTEWHNLSWLKDRKNFWNLRRHYHANPEFLDVKVSCQHLFSEWPDPAKVADQISDTSSQDKPVSKGRGGRKPKAGADEFWIEICRNLMDGEVRTQEQLSSKMRDWCARNQVEYEADTVSKKISSLFAGLGWSDGVVRD